MNMTSVKFKKDLPSYKSLLSGVGASGEAILIYDRKLEKYPFINKYIKTFPFKFAVTSGESLKTLEKVDSIFTRLQKDNFHFGPHQTVFVGLGGGSLGDFVGFLASIYKRGAKLVHIPTTWLAAMDSSHGGKTALNINNVKNQVGTYYSADRIYIVKSVLMKQPESLIYSALGELVKMAFIDSRSLVMKFKGKKAASELIWKMLPLVIQAKYKVVNKDPFEKKGLRYVLNLGHTFGHVLESRFAVPHGMAVAQGLYFTIYWSLHRKYLSPVVGKEMLNILNQYFKDKILLKQKAVPIQPDRALKLLQQDKKKLGAQIQFVFLKGMGRPFLKKVTPDQIIKEMSRQGWIK